MDAVRGIGHKRQVAGMLQRHGPALLAAGLGLGGHAFADECGQLGHHLRIGDVERECVGRGQRVLPEPERQPREFGGVLAVKLLVGVGKGRAAASETLIGVLEQFPVLFAKTSRMLVNLFHPGEQLGIERDVVRQFGQLGLHAQCDLLHFVRRIRFEQVEEDTRDTIQQRTVALQSHDGIAEGRLRGVGDDRVDLGMRAGDGRVERRLVVREFDLGERRGAFTAARFLFTLSKKRNFLTPRFSLREDKNCTNTNGQRFLLFVLYYTWKNIKTECLLPLFL